jgi:hypothetical protein
MPKVKVQFPNEDQRVEGPKDATVELLLETDEQGLTVREEIRLLPQVSMTSVATSEGITVAKVEP